MLLGWSHPATTERGVVVALEMLRSEDAVPRVKLEQPVVAAAVFNSDAVQFESAGSRPLDIEENFPFLMSKAESVEEFLS